MAESGGILGASDQILAENGNDDSGITMVDVLEEEQELEEDANAVLGGSDDQNCTYPMGYAKRQALYACGTCSEDVRKSAGVCLACSYACHEGHKLVELYTKRNFRCDCGNSKFQKNPCKLFPEKESSNADNSYNQNFQGVYCTCARPYPDPEDDIEDEMIQCIMCEDWLHGRHLGTPVPTNNEYGEMVCGQCMSSHTFLWAYAVVSAEVCKISKNVAEDGIIVNNCSDRNNADSCAKEDGIADAVPKPEKGFEIKENGTAKKVLSSEEIKDQAMDHASDCSSDASACFWKELSKREMKYQPGTAVFWPDGWRQKLCRCPACKELYAEKKAMFLLDDEDTVHSYEEQGKAKTSGQSRYDQGMQALSQLDRIRQVEAIHEYNDMKSELKDFLKNFAEKKKVVRKEDIDEFFSQMHARKRQRVDVSIPHFCR